ncbi:calcium-binding protein [Paracoccus sp. (in: a-proteobacteria)]|uniref:calcium-binding protein n=1 Tax=Paracoccus sp. TaxID=267 RepID=UPI0026E0139D|nr:calcium-binding protein [Paracoccus sp. (in: a-proteobacteria)]MDO5646721.1 calcium-binding protein [Paracoccus sp. (in: a-proteobacteria)]
MTLIPGDTTTTARISQTGQTRGRIDFQDDSDWYRLKVQPGLAYSVWLTGDGTPDSVPDRTAYTRMMDSDGSRLDGLSPAYSFQSRLNFTSQRNADYFVNVSGGSQLGNYIIHTNMDDRVVNNTTTTASVVRNGVTSGRLDVAGDSDWYRVTLTEGLSYGFRLTGDGTTDTARGGRLYLMDSSGQRAGGSSDVGLGGQLNYRVGTTGDYYVNVATYYGASDVGNFQIHSVMTDTVRNNTLTDAALTVNGVTAGRLDVAGDADWYRVTLTEGLSYGFRLTGDGTTDTARGGRLYLMDSSGQRAGGSSDVGLGGQLNYRVGTTGDYYVNVATYYGASDVGNFQIHSVMTDTVRNDTLTNAALTVNGVTSGRLDVAGDSDWYRVTLTEGLTYGFRLTGDGTTDTARGGRLYLMDGSGHRAEDSSDVGLGGGTLTYRVTTTGEYYVNAATYFGASDVGNFQINAVMSDTVRDDTLTTARLVRNGVTTGKLDVAGDADWYRVTLTEGLSANFRLTGDGTTPVGSNARITLRNADGSVASGVSSSSVSTGGDLGVNVARSGTYFLSVSNGEGNFRVHTDQRDTVRGDVLTGAVALSGHAIKGRIDSVVDQDWYKVRLNAGTKYYIDGMEMSGTGGIGDHIVTLYDIHGQRLDYTWGSKNPFIRYDPDATGDYLIAVSGSRGSMGDFKLRVVSDQRNVTGTSGADELHGYEGANRMVGGAGNDTLFGYEGDDTLIGGSGDDILDGGAGNDTAEYTSTANTVVDLAITGRQNTRSSGWDTLVSIENVITGRGNDTIRGDGQANQLYGGDGNDRVDGRAGNDSLYGGAGNDVIYGGGGNDALYGGADNDELYGGAGGDLLYGGAGDDQLFGGTGRDSLYGGSGNDRLSGGSASDHLYGGTGNDRLFGGAHNDWLEGGAGNDSLYGGDGNDTLLGGAGDDLIFGGAGVDTVRFNTSANITVSLAVTTAQNTGEGLDTIREINNVMTGSGHDRVTGDDSANVLSGLGGNDVLMGRGGNDRLFGGEGNDRLFGGAGNDQLYGGNGADLLEGSTGRDTLYGGNGNDTLRGGSDADMLYGDAGNDLIYGDTGADQLFGGDGQDRLYGGSGDDTLSGGNGNDSLYGGAGRDRLIAGAGNDQLWGGTNADVFVFARGDDWSRINDWQDGLDKIEISGTNWWGLSRKQTDAGVEVSFSWGATLTTIEIAGAKLADIDQSDFIFV